MKPKPDDDSFVILNQKPDFKLRPPKKKKAKKRKAKRRAKEQS